MRNLILFSLILCTASVSGLANYTIQLACVDTANREAKRELILDMASVEASWHELRFHQFYEINEADYTRAFQKCTQHHPLGFKLEGYKSGVLSAVSKYHRVYERQRNPVALNAYEIGLTQNLNAAAGELIKTLPELTDKRGSSLWKNAVDEMDRLISFRAQDFYSKTAKPNLLILRNELMRQSNDLLRAMEKDSLRLDNVTFDMRASYSLFRMHSLQQMLDGLDKGEGAELIKSDAIGLLAKSWIEILLKVTTGEVQALGRKQK